MQPRALPDRQPNASHMRTNAPQSLLLWVIVRRDGPSPDSCCCQQPASQCNRCLQPPWGARAGWQLSAWLCDRESFRNGSAGPWAQPARVWRPPSRARAQRSALSLGSWDLLQRLPTSDQRRPADSLQERSVHPIRDPEQACVDALASPRCTHSGLCVRTNWGEIALVAALLPLMRPPRRCCGSPASNVRR